MIDFHGWVMPVWFEGMVKEHQAVRERAGVFDISHMGLVRILGADALKLCDLVFTGNLQKLKVGKAKYGLVCNERGVILDDVIFYKAEDHMRVIINASNVPKITRWLQDNSKGMNVSIEEDPGSLVKMAVQGPKVQEIVDAGEPRLAFGELARFSWKAVDERMITRTGYTGEDGFEVVTTLIEGMELYDVITQQLGIAPIGLGARDTLRLEHGYSLYGNEIDETTHPFEAGLAWVVDLKKEHYIGREAHAAQKDAVTRQVVGLIGDSGPSPRSHDVLVDGDGKQIGHVTSGSHSPTLGKPIALGYVPSALAVNGTTVYFQKGGKARPLTVTGRDFLVPKS